VHRAALLKGSPGAAVKLLPCDYVVMGYILEIASCRNVGKGCNIRPKVVRPFPGPCAGRSYVHWAALFVKQIRTWTRWVDKAGQFD
jgi:hypothetical protein